MKVFIIAITVAGLIANGLAAPNHHTGHEGHSHDHNHGPVANGTVHTAGHDNHNHTVEASHGHHGHDHHNSPSSNHSHVNHHFDNDGHASHQPGDKVHSLNLHVKCHVEHAPSTQCANGTTNLFYFDMGRNTCNQYEEGKCPSAGNQNSFTSMDECLKCMSDGNTIKGAELTARAAVASSSSPAPVSTSSAPSSTSSAPSSTSSAPSSTSKAPSSTQSVAPASSTSAPASSSAAPAP